VIVFDTDVISYVLSPSPPAGLIRRVADVDPDEQTTTAVTAGELIYGAWRSSRPEHFLAALRDRVWPNIRVLSFDLAAAMIYGRLRANLERKGTPMAEPDLRIAATCLRHDATLATGNLRHFAKVPDLRVEDWLADYR
jgi:predicted nucleic acid-binding protein